MSELENQSIGPSLPFAYKLRQGFGSVIGRRFDHLLDSITIGRLSVTWPDDYTTHHGTRHHDPTQNAHIVLHNFKPVRQMLSGGENGFAESYLRGDWSTDSLRNLFSVIMNNESAVAAMTTGGWLAQLFNSFKHERNRNSVQGSQRNIEFHYDIGNDFYKLWLDQSMSYSSAVFADNESLEEAQNVKLMKVVEALDPGTGAKVLEIGCGWGAMARKLAEESACHVEGISLSHEQLNYARTYNSVVPKGQTQGSTNFRHQDYRHVEGSYDHIVSIEMFEAVGEQYWDAYFAKIAELLDQGGTALLQVITIAEERFEQYRDSPDFIQRYIFPGGMLPSKTHLLKLIDKAGFELVGSDWFGQSYATTLAHWRERFERVHTDLQLQGFDERFMRMWRYYLSYCEIGFRFERTNVGQLLLCKR